GPLPGAGELHHVGAQVVGLDDARQRAALPQRRQVGGCGHPGQRHGCSIQPSAPSQAAHNRGQTVTSGTSSSRPRPCRPCAKTCVSYGTPAAASAEANCSECRASTISSSAVAHTKHGGTSASTWEQVD